MQEIKLPVERIITEKVTEDKLAVNVGSGSLRVFATPALAATMEKCACLVLDDYLEENETTVGTFLQLNHNAPTPLGAEVNVKAVLNKVNGREFEFEIIASDNAGEIAKCTHKRFLVYKDKFQAKANGRV